MLFQRECTTLHCHQQGIKLSIPLQHVALYMISSCSMTVWITTNWKILQEIGIPDHLTCLLRNLYAGQEATVRAGHGTTYWFQIEKGVCQGCILSPCLFNLYAENIIQILWTLWERE